MATKRRAAVDASNCSHERTILTVLEGGSSKEITQLYAVLTKQSKRAKKLQDIKKKNHKLVLI